MSEIISSDKAFSAQQIQLLASLVEMMVPANGEFPGAAEPEILTVIINKLSTEESTVTDALGLLESLSQQDYGMDFSGLASAQQEKLFERMKHQASSFIQMLQVNVLSSYYQNQKVLSALGVPARSPYPDGYTVAETDWSILDPVRERDPFYKKI